MGFDDSERASSRGKGKKYIYAAISGIFLLGLTLFIAYEHNNTARTYVAINPRSDEVAHTYVAIHPRADEVFTPPVSLGHVLVVMNSVGRHGGEDYLLRSSTHHRNIIIGENPH